MVAAPLISGVFFALAAGLMWGLVFIGPLLLPEYPATLQSFGRYLAFGLIALPLAWFDRARLREPARADWIEALKLALVGNIVFHFARTSYFLFFFKTSLSCRELNSLQDTDMKSLGN